jgi:ATP-dependent helicase/DNAse subunit B
MKLMSPPLALGQVVHEVLESLSVLPTEKRLSDPLMEKFDKAWERVKGKKGGFFDMQTELQYQNRGRAMIRRVMENPGPITRLAVKIQQDLPFYWLSEEENIILCGKVDWLEYLPEEDAVHIIDFKTGKEKEDAASLQLPIYHLLVHNCQKRKVARASYWYVESNDSLTEKELPSLEEAQKKVYDIALKIKLARQLKKFSCPKEGCYACEPYEKIFRGEAEHIGKDEYGADTYIIEKKADDTPESIIL